MQQLNTHTHTHSARPKKISVRFLTNCRAVISNSFQDIIIIIITVIMIVNHYYLLLKEYAFHKGGNMDASIIIFIWHCLNNNINIYKYLYVYIYKPINKLHGNIPNALSIIFLATATNIS